MNHTLRLAVFRAFAPDLGVGGGAASEDAPEDGASSFDELADQAYASLSGSEGRGAEDEDEEEEDEEEAGEDASAADGDAIPSAGLDDPLALDPGFAKAHPEQAQAYESRVAALRQNEASLAPVLELEEALADPWRAPETLRSFAEALAQHHGFDLGAVFGGESAEPGYGTSPEAAPDWRDLGFDSWEAYAEAPEYAQAGFDSPGEVRIARELAELRATVAPFLQQQQRMAAEAEAVASRGRFEAAVRSVAPSVLASLRAEHGFAATEAQAIEAATRFPALAAQDLGSAILAAFPLELARHYAQMAAGKRPRRPDMPEGGGRRGHVAPDVASASFDELADHVYATL